MNLRRFGALLALIALTFSFAEGVWASSCAPGGTMEGMPAQSSADDCMDAMAADADMAEGPLSESPADPHCPFAPLSTAGVCLVAASMPSQSPAELAPSPEGAHLTIAPERTRDLLLASALFHPPRA